MVKYTNKRKIARDNNYETIHSNKPQRTRPNGSISRPRTHSGADSNKQSLKPSKSSTSSHSSSSSSIPSQSSVSRSATQHLPSMSKPFKKIFKRSHDKDRDKDKDNDHNHGHSHHHSNSADTTHHQSHIQSSRGYSSHHNRYSTKSSKRKSGSDSNISKTKTVNLKKMIDKKLLKQYEQFVKDRVEMLQTRAFPHQVIHQLPEYRAERSYDMIHSMHFILVSFWWIIHNIQRIIWHNIDINRIFLVIKNAMS